MEQILRRNEVIYLFCGKVFYYPAFDEVIEMKKGVLVFTMFTAIIIFCVVALLINAQAPEQAKIVFSYKVGDNADNNMETRII
jgi:hypothetical protein